jgi:hypothetical protein
VMMVWTQPFDFDAGDVITWVHEPCCYQFYVFIEKTVSEHENIGPSTLLLVLIACSVFYLKLSMSDLLLKSRCYVKKEG